jgi:hypothetical protein
MSINLLVFRNVANIKKLYGVEMGADPDDGEPIFPAGKSVRDLNLPDDFHLAADIPASGAGILVRKMIDSDICPKGGLVCRIFDNTPIDRFELHELDALRAEVDEVWRHEDAVADEYVRAFLIGLETAIDAAKEEGNPILIV